MSERIEPTLITKANGKDRVIDFRDNLVAAQTETYATLHQEGGLKSNGYPSRIKLTICDFSKGTGVDERTQKGKATTVSFNLEPDIPFEWYEVVKSCLGTSIYPMKSSVPKKGGKAWEKELVDNDISRVLKNTQIAGMAANALGSFFAGVTTLLGKIVTGKVTAGSNDANTELGKSVKAARDSFAAQVEIPEAISIRRGVDYSFVADKVNVYKKEPDGYAPVSRLTVTRNSLKNGDISNYPWTFKITNGKALVQEKDTGATTFDGNSMKEKTEAYIMVSDRDMFRMMNRVTHFISVWENGKCIPLVLAGEAMMQQRREEYRSQNDNF